MRRVRIAILDSGIENCHSLFKYTKITGFGINYRDHRIELSKDYSDQHGHGTACASMIVNMCPDAELLIIKILNQDGKTNLQILEYALEHLLERDVSVIHMSIAGQDTVDHRLEHICESLKAQNKILVASYANDFSDSFPAGFDSVIGVRGAVLKTRNEFWFPKKGNLQCIIENIPSMAAIPGNKYCMMTPSNSMAAAKMSGIICGLMRDINDGEDRLACVCRQLYKAAYRNVWTEEDIAANRWIPQPLSWSIKNQDRQLILILELVKQYFAGQKIFNPKICDIELYTSRGLLKIENVYDFLKYVEKGLGLTFHYMNINRFDLITVGTLTMLAKNALYNG